MTADGWVEVPGLPPFKKVSPALKACVGTEVNGWSRWVHERSGRSLSDLRDQLQRQFGGRPVTSESSDDAAEGQ